MTKVKTKRAARRRPWPRGFSRQALNDLTAAWLDIAVQDGRIVTVWDAALYIGLEFAAANRIEVHSTEGRNDYLIRANCREIRTLLLKLKLLSVEDMRRAYRQGAEMVRDSAARVCGTAQEIAIKLLPSEQQAVESGAPAGPSVGFQRAEKAWVRPADDLGDFYNRVRTDMHSLDMEQAELIDRVLKPIRSDRLVAALATRPGTLGAVMAAQVLTIKKGEDYNAREVNSGKTGHSASRDDYFPFGALSYVQMIHVKSERLKNLVTKTMNGGAPNNESLLDSTLDLINYASFLAEYLRRGNGGTEE